MSVNSNALIVPGRGTVFQAPKNTACPADPLTSFNRVGEAPADWSNLGHTSKNNTIAFSREGGETTSLDTFLQDSVRVITSPVAWGLNVPALQIDNDILDLAFNGDWDTEKNGYIIPGSSKPTESALFLLFEDNTGKLGFYIPNTTVTLGEAPSVDTEYFFELPLAASILSAPEEVINSVEGDPGIMMLFKTGLTA